ncbi:branched-chain amino acid ABC transporter permease [Egibacter rhizosphaerae]|uniref:branched-chain amino acid ABC transporter permease n=1 Tax=Egibacter rhizosphaerae TaxID=1670831 RepID=UPI0013F16B84|nr:branched-chain amino acid ABC transporter permease [Egibacter rhizosphaerae]
MLTILTQTLVTGILLAGLYAIFGLGLSLGWGLLHTINFGHFANAFLAAYVTFELTRTIGWDPLVSLVVTIPLGVLLGMALQVFVTVTKIDVFGTLIVTFGFFLIIEAAMTMIWTADLVRIPLEANPYFTMAFRAGPLVMPAIGLFAVLAATVACGGVYWLLNRTYAGKGIRAFVQDPEMAGLFGVNYRSLSMLVAAIAGGTVGATGTLIALLFVLTPSAAELWVAVIFAVVLLGGLANPVGIAGAALIIGLVESLTRQFADPAMARLTALVVLIIALIFKPEGLFKPVVERAHE